MRTPWLTGNPQRLTLAHVELALETPDLPASIGWPQSPFLEHFVNHLLVECQIPTGPFSRRFSSSSCFIFLISLGAISPNFFFPR